MLQFRIILSLAFPVVFASSHDLAVNKDLEEAFGTTQMLVEMEFYSDAKQALRTVEIEISTLEIRMQGLPIDFKEEMNQIVNAARERVRTYRDLLGYSGSNQGTINESSGPNDIGARTMDFLSNHVPQDDEEFVSNVHFGPNGMDYPKTSPPNYGPESENHANPELSEIIVPEEMYDVGGNGFPEKLGGLYEKLDQLRKTFIDDGADKLAVQKLWDEILSCDLVETISKYKQFILPGDTNSPEYFKPNVGEDIWAFMQRYVGKASRLMTRFNEQAARRSNDTSSSSVNDHKNQNWDYRQREWHWEREREQEREREREWERKREEEWRREWERKRSRYWNEDRDQDREQNEDWDRYVKNNFPSQRHTSYQDRDGYGDWSRDSSDRSQYSRYQNRDLNRDSSDRFPSPRPTFYPHRDHDDDTPPQSPRSAFRQERNQERGWHRRSPEH